MGGVSDSGVGEDCAVPYTPATLTAHTALNDAHFADGGANSRMVLRDNQGDFSAGTITADLTGGDLTGNAATASALAANPTDCSGVQFARGINAAGTASCAQPSDVTGNAATVSNGVYTTGTYANPAWITSLAGSKITGNITGNADNITGTLAASNGGTGVSGGSSGKLVCWKTATTLGYCSTLPTGGNCTCQ